MTAELNLEIEATAFDPLPRDRRTFQDIPIEKLVIDPHYQREHDPNHILKIASAFRWDLFESITVTPIGRGVYRVTEGQGRILALRRRSYSGIVRNCAVLPKTTTPENEADVAYGITNGRRPHSALAKWELRVNRGDAHEVAAEEVLRSHRLALGRAPSKHVVACVAKLSEVIHHGRNDPEMGAEQLEAVLSIIEAAFPDDEPESTTSRFDGHLVRAVHGIIVRNPHADLKKVAKILSGQSARRWIGSSKMVGAPPHVVIGRAISDRYNARLARGNEPLQW